MDSNASNGVSCNKPVTNHQLQHEIASFKALTVGLPVEITESVKQRYIRNSIQ